MLGFFSKQHSTRHPKNMQQIFPVPELPNKNFIIMLQTSNKKLQTFIALIYFLINKVSNAI